MSKLSERIKFLREKEGLNQKEFAKKMNISRSTASMYESGKNTPPDDIKIAMAKYFNVSLDYLMGLTSDPTPSRKITTDFASILEEMDFVLENTPSLMLHGDVMDEETKELLQASLKMAMMISKTKAGKNE